MTATQRVGRLAVHRTFEVAAPRERVWSHLARPAEWPSWARHIRSIEMTPPGEIVADSVGVIRLTNRVRSSFRMTDLWPGERWTWEGGFLWLRIRYDHVFEAVAAGRTRVTFDVWAAGLGSRTLGRLFACVYARNLDRALPRLVAEIEGRVTD